MNEQETVADAPVEDTAETAETPVEAPQEEAAEEAAAPAEEAPAVNEPEEA